MVENVLLDSDQARGERVGMIVQLENSSVSGERVGLGGERVELGGENSGAGYGVGVGGGNQQPDVIRCAQHQKRKNTTSGEGVSPMTLQAQPPRKRRPGVGRQLINSESDGMFFCFG